MRSRRAAALAVLVLLAAGCGSQRSERHARPATGPPGVVRIGLAHLLSPLDPAHAHGRDEIAVGRALFSTPLRTDPETGALRPGLCDDWRASADRRTWRFRCRHARAIAAELRRTHLAARRVEASDERRIVAERPGLRLEFRKLEPHAALRLYRRGRLDEAPAPLGDLRALQRDPRLGDEVRVRRLLAVDLVVFAPRGSLARRPELRRAYDETADRADYQALVPEFAAPPAENLTERGEPNARPAVLAARRARHRIKTLPRVAVRFAIPSDPDLAYGAALLVASWRDLGLGAVLGRGRPDARFERVLAPYPRLEDELGAVDYRDLTAP